MGIMSGLNLKGLFGGHGGAPGAPSAAPGAAKRPNFLSRLGDAADGIGMAQQYLNGDYGGAMDAMAERRRKRKAAMPQQPMQQMQQPPMRGLGPWDY